MTGRRRLLAVALQLAIAGCGSRAVSTANPSLPRPLVSTPAAAVSSTPQPPTRPSSSSGTSHSRPARDRRLHHPKHHDGGEAQPLHVSGRHLVNAHGRQVRLLGFDTFSASTCVNGVGTFDVGTATNSAVPAKDVEAMASWRGANAVRLPLNEQCWLGLGAVQPSMSGATYQDAVENYVERLNKHGFAVILDLHLNAPGDESALNQEPMPDQHSIDFWKQVAAMFALNRSVLFDLFNEPWPDNESTSAAAWSCWQLGGCAVRSTNGTDTYTAVGMSQLLSAVRSTGARNVVMLGGVNYASNLGEWLKYAPSDPAHELAASLHSYPFGACNSLACYSDAPEKVARHVPLVIGEFGSDTWRAPNPAGCPTSDVVTNGFDTNLLQWAEDHRVSWLAWTWNAWSDSCNALITNLDGRPTTPYGVRVRTALRQAGHTHAA
jgi:hypothetical protein